MKTYTLIDGDSICYMAAYSSTIEDVFTAINNALCGIITATGCDKYAVYIEEFRKPKTLFRSKLYNLSNNYTKHPNYKGNRVHNTKPEFLTEARQYIMSRWNAQVVEDFESEDRVIQLAYKYQDKYNIVIAAVDKDLAMHAFTFYDYRKKKMHRILPDQATLNLWRQVCSGDMTDNIPGIPGIGKTRATNAIQDPNSAMQDAVKLFKSKELSYEYFIETYNLIYIRKEETQELLYPNNLTKEQWHEIQ